MIHSFVDFIRSLTDPERLIHLLSTLLSGWLGYAALFGVVYSETGLLVGFFFPGDSLLFTVGVVAGAGQLNIALVIVVLWSAAMLGDSTGFFLGRRTGARIFSRPDSRLFKRDYVIRTKAVLRALRRQDHRLRAVCAHRAHVRGLHGRRDGDALPALPALQRVRRHRLGVPDDHAGL